MERKLTMERSKRQSAERKLVVPRLVNERQLASFLSSEGGKNKFVQRLAETLRQAWCRIQELEGEPPKSNLQEERDWTTCERVLVLSETDGSVEVYAESWVALKHLEIKPWEERDEQVGALSADWKRLYQAPKSKCLIVPQIRPKLDEAALLDLARWHERAMAVELLLRLRSEPL